jgi:molybdopterin molybdotransferase
MVAEFKSKRWNMAMLTPGEAQDIIFKVIKSRPCERVDLLRAHGRVLQEDLIADRDLPPFNRSTMDGFALRAEACSESQKSFVSHGVQAAGLAATTLHGDTNACLEIMTGAVVPAGANAVVPYEEVDVSDKVTIKPGVNVLAGQNIHLQGSDAKKSSTLVKKGIKLSAREIAVAASCGYESLNISTQPRIALISTGDELVDVSSVPLPHQIRKSNSYALHAALNAAGYTQVVTHHFFDNEMEVEKGLRHALLNNDVLILTGGVSKGKFDYLPKQLSKQGVNNLIHGVKQKPGKPFWFGVSATNIPVFALPGNPVSSYICLHRYVIPALRLSSGLLAQSTRYVSLKSELTVNAKTTHFVPVRLIYTEQGHALAEPLLSNTSGDFIGLVESHGFIELKEGKAQWQSGSFVPFTAWA